MECRRCGEPIPDGDAVRLTPEAAVHGSCFLKSVPGSLLKKNDEEDAG